MQNIGHIEDVRPKQFLVVAGGFPMAVVENERIARLATEAILSTAYAGHYDSKQRLFVSANGMKWVEYMA